MMRCYKSIRLCVQTKCFIGRVKLYSSNCAISDCVIRVATPYYHRKFLIIFIARLFHLSFDLGVQCPYPYQCDMDTNSIGGNQ